MILPILTAALLLNYDDIFFDIDGVVRVGPRYLPGSIDILNLLTEHNKTVTFVSNNGHQRPTDRALDFQRNGFKYAQASSFLNPMVVLLDRLRKENFYNKTVFCICPQAGREMLQSELNATVMSLPPPPEGSQFDFENPPFNKEMHADAVIIDSYPAFNMNTMMKGMNLLASNDTAFYCLSGDLMFVSENRLRYPDAGTVRAALEQATGRKAESMGKPSKNFNDYVRNIRKHPGSKSLMFGDSLVSDMTFAHANGFHSVLVNTGLSNEHDVMEATVKGITERIPTYFGEIPKLVEQLKKLPGDSENRNIHRQ